MPPPTGTEAPVRYAPARDARYTAAPARSSGSPMRPSGTWAASRGSGAGVVQDESHHLGVCERAGRDGVDRDVLGCQPLGEMAGEMHDPRLGRRVRVGLQVRHLQPVHGGDVDHPGRIVRAGRGTQQSQQLLGEEERAAQVGVDDFVPAVHRELVELRTPACARVVDENVERLPSLGHRPGQGLAALRGGQIARYCLAWAPGRELGGRSRHLLHLAGRDDHPATRVEQPPGDHVAEAAAAAGDHGRLAVKSKQSSQAINVHRHLR